MAGTRSITYDLDELSNVAAITAKDTRDGLFQRLPLLEACQKAHGKGGKSRDGGNKWRQNLSAFEHSVATGLPTGYEEINLDVRGTNRTFEFNPACVTAPILISQTERNIHHGQAALNDLGAERTGNVLDAQMRAWHKHIIRGGVAGYDAWATLNGVDANSLGLLEEDPVGTQGNSYGGLSKSTLSGVPAMSNERYDFAAKVGQNGRAGVLHVYNRINEFTKNEGNHVVMATQAGLGNLQRVMQPYMRFTTTGGGGSAELLGPDVVIKGKPVYASSHMATDGAVTQNDPISLMVVDLDAIYPVWLKADTDGCFGVTPFTQHSGSFRVFVAYVDINGQMWVKAYNSSAVFIDGETF